VNFKEICEDLKKELLSSLKKQDEKLAIFIKYKMDLFETVYEERFSNLNGLVYSLQKDMVDYMQANPKCDDQWTEERLRALELKVKELQDGSKRD
jgi:hypothetical protein